MIEKIIISIIAIGLLLTTPIVTLNAFELESLVINDSGPFDCYTLVNPFFSKNTYLIDNNGTIVNMWQSDYFKSLPAYLLENGSLLRSCALQPFSSQFWHGGLGGRVEMFDWDGNLIWNFEHIGDDYCLHNDIEVLPNGNILMIVWNYKTRSEAIAAGIDPNDPELIENGYMLTDYIIEVEPTFPSGGNIVWEWHVWDHLIQDEFPYKDNYGVVADHPELLDINYEGRYYDITHINSIEYIEKFDQILISARMNNEIWVIDHSFKKTESPNSSSGILYRWGNPQVYDAGDEDDQILFMQHDARWIEEGLPGEGHITIYNNGLYRPGEDYSSIIEIDPPVDSNGDYHLEPFSAYGPEETEWIYTAKNPTDFYSPQMSGAQRLPNGNTRVCCGDPGYFFEVTPDNEIVWEYFNPYPVPYPLPYPYINRIYKTQCYAKDYPGIREFSTSIESRTVESEATFTEDSQNYQQQSLPFSSPSN